MRPAVLFLVSCCHASWFADAITEISDFAKNIFLEYIGPDYSYDDVNKLGDLPTDLIKRIGDELDPASLMGLSVCSTVLAGTLRPTLEDKFLSKLELVDGSAAYRLSLLKIFDAWQKKDMHKKALKALLARNDQFVSLWHDVFEQKTLRKDIYKAEHSVFMYWIGTIGRIQDPELIKLALRFPEKIHLVNLETLKNALSAGISRTALRALIDGMIPQALYSEDFIERMMKMRVSRKLLVVLAIELMRRNGPNQELIDFLVRFSTGQDVIENLEQAPKIPSVKVSDYAIELVRLKFSKLVFKVLFRKFPNLHLLERLIQILPHTYVHGMMLEDPKSWCSSPGAIHTMVLFCQTDEELMALLVKIPHNFEMQILYDTVATLESKSFNVDTVAEFRRRFPHTKFTHRQQQQQQQQTSGLINAHDK